MIPKTLDDLFDHYGDDSVYFLESTRKYTRYAVPSNSNESESIWICNECTGIVTDEMTGCSDCYPNKYGEEE